MMNDLIRREDAYNHFAKGAELFCNTYGNIGGACSGAAKYIKSLPSATSSGWIPCSKNLPESGMTEDGNVLKYVFIQDEYGDMHIAHYDKSITSTNGWYMIDRKTDGLEAKIIAWMPLPKPYKAESEDK